MAATWHNAQTKTLKSGSSVLKSYQYCFKSSKRRRYWSHPWHFRKTKPSRLEDRLTQLHKQNIELGSKISRAFAPWNCATAFGVLGLALNLPWHPRRLSYPFVLLICFVFVFVSRVVPWRMYHVPFMSQAVMLSGVGPQGVWPNWLIDLCCSKSCAPIFKTCRDLRSKRCRFRLRNVKPWSTRQMQWAPRANDQKPTSRDKR